MNDAINKIEKEIKKARARSSTDNFYDYAYANGLQWALDQIKGGCDHPEHKLLWVDAEKTVLYCSCGKHIENPAEVPIKSVHEGKCPECRFNDKENDECVVGTYYAGKGSWGVCKKGELWKPIN